MKYGYRYKNAVAPQFRFSFDDKLIFDWGKLVKEVQSFSKALASAEKKPSATTFKSALRAAKLTSFALWLNQCTTLYLDWVPLSQTLFKLQKNGSEAEALQPLREARVFIQMALDSVAPENFIYHGFNVTNKHHLEDALCRRALEGVDLLIATFENRGVDKLLAKGLDRINLAAVGGAPNSVAFYGSIKGADVPEITLFAGPNSKGFDRNGLSHFIHEFGHHVYYTILPGEARKVWDTPWDESEDIESLEVPTEYGKVNKFEDFAETFAVFMTKPEMLTPMAKFRMQRTLSIAGLYGKPVIRIAARVATRWKLAAFLSDKWFKEKKAELRDILKKPLKDNPDYWGFLLRDHMEGFFERFQREFEEQVELPLARTSVKGRVASAMEYTKALVEKLDKVGSLRNNVDFSDAASYLRWNAVVECHDKMAQSVKTFGDLYKYSWFISEDVINRLVKKALKGASPEELESLVGEGDYRTKYDYLNRIGFKAAALKALKRGKLDAFDPTKWVDRIYEILAANYSEQALADSNLFTEFDLHGMKVVVNDATVDASQTKKYVTYLQQAYAALKAKGFAKAWYGTVYIACEECGGRNENTGGGVGGWYETAPDTVTIFVRPSSFLVELMAHELGHRFWFKQMSSSQRAKFSDLVKTHTIPRPSTADTVNILKEGIVQRPKQKVLEAQKRGEHNLARSKQLDLSKATSAAKHAIPKALWDVSLDISDALSDLDLKDLGPEIQGLKDSAYDTASRLRGRADDFTLISPQEPSSSTMSFAQWYEDVEQLLAQAVAEALIYIDASVQAHNEQERKKAEANPALKAWMDSYENNPNPVLPVSAYGHSNVSEAFAEVFAHYVLEADMTRDQVESFKAVLKTSSLASRVARRFVTAYI